jgi:hypothetical protein
MTLPASSSFLPDWECSDCANAVWGKQPVHCIKCGGTKFSGIAKPIANDVGEVASVLERIVRDSGALRKAVGRLQRPEGRKVIERMYACQKAAQQALILLMEPTRYERDQERAEDRGVGRYGGNIERPSKAG